MRPTKPANESASTPATVNSDAFVWTTLPAHIVVPSQLSIVEMYRKAFESARERVIAHEVARRLKRRDTLFLN